MVTCPLEEMLARKASGRSPEGRVARNWPLNQCLEKPLVQTISKLHQEKTTKTSVLLAASDTDIVFFY